MSAGLKIRLSAFVGTFFYLGLAVLGWGGFGPFSQARRASRSP
jgi:hypothetical protein